MKTDYIPLAFINNMKYLWRNWLPFSLALLVMFQISSCGGSKNATYFEEIGDQRFTAVHEAVEPILQKNDLISITVNSLNADAAEMFNKSNGTITSGTYNEQGGNSALGYLVNEGGNIIFPYLGKIKVAGMTKKELREFITSELITRRLLLEPIVDIRYLNFKVSVLGEVSNPSVFKIPNEKVTLLEALGMAGDMTVFAERTNVLLISEENGAKITKRIDLTTDELFTSPNYYLRSNDIVYVQANKRKVRNTSNASQWVSIILGSLSLAVISIASFR